MNRILTFVALFGLLVCLACAAPAKKSEDTETQQTDETKQISEQTHEETKSTNTAQETSKTEDSNPSNQEVTKYEEIEADDDSKVTRDSEPNKRAQPHQVQKVGEHILTQNEAMALVTELTDGDYVDQYLFNEGADGLFQALDLLRDQGWITDIEYTIISDSIYQQMLAGIPYEIEEESSIADSEMMLQPGYNTFSSYTESEQESDARLADVVGSLLDRISDEQMNPDEGAAIISAIFKILYGLEDQQVDAAYSDDWTQPEQYFDYPNMKGYKQNFDIVNDNGEPIGKAQEIVETYKTDDGELGKELAALEQMGGQFGDNGVFQGQQQTYAKEAIIPLSPMMNTGSSSEEEGSGSSSEEESASSSFMDSTNNLLGADDVDRLRYQLFGKLGKLPNIPFKK